MKAIWKRELQGYFHTPVGYVFLGVFLAISSVLFYLVILSARSSNLPKFLSEISAIWMLVSPILTMRLLAEERQKKTDQLLLTSPVSLPGIVAGKYLAAVTVLLITSALTLLYVLIVALYGQVYPAELAVNYLGFILEGCAFTALDLFLSGCAATPVTAAVLAFGANFLLWILDLLQTAVQAAWISDALKFISLYRRNEAFQMGQLSFACIFYDLAFIALFLTLTVYLLDRRRTGGGSTDGSLKQMLRRGMTKKKEAADGEIRRIRRKKRRYSSVSALLLVMLAISFAAISIGADALENRNGLRIDLSYNSISTYSEKTQEVLENLQHDVHIWALFRNGYEDIQLLELLNRYSATSSRITWEQTDITLNPTLVARFTTELGAPQDDGLIVWCEDTGRSHLISAEEYSTVLGDPETNELTSAIWNYESVLTEAIYYVTRERVPQVVILQGHNELGIEELETFEYLLKANQYEVRYADLENKEFQPDPRDLLVFFSPRQDLSDAELEKLGTFASQGGSFLFTRDFDDETQKMPNYRTLLRSCGFECIEGIVTADPEAVNTYYDTNTSWLLPEMLSTDMTIDLIEYGMDQIMMPGAAAFETPEDTDRYMMTSVVLQSGETARLVKAADTAAGSIWTETNEKGPFALALQSWRITTDGYLSRAFIIGCSSSLINEKILSMTNGQELIIRSLEYLMDREASNLDIMPKVAIRPALSAGSTALGSVLLVALPAAVLLAALLVLIRRRNR